LLSIIIVERVKYVKEMLKIVCMDYITESILYKLIAINANTGNFIDISLYDIPIVEREKLMLKTVSGLRN